MRYLQIVLGFAVSVCLLPALVIADDKDKGKVRKTESAPDLVFVPENDKEMNAAMEKARKSIDEFGKVFQERKKEHSDFGVKVAIRDGKKVEHFWVQISKFDGKQFAGKISNDPQIVKTVQAGNKISVDKDKISDWMYVENKKLVGGFTVRVLRDRLSPAERKALDRSVPYKIE
ncbi:MAG: DUF2314 domain-containing protein [Gemmataceae bacterium]|nr:DUF2314 domain-containing protein [Gemmataceae bacterium]